MNLTSNFTKIAVALSLVLILGLMAAPAALAASHLSNTGDSDSVESEAEQNLETTQNDRNDRFEGEREQTQEQTRNKTLFKKKLKDVADENATIKIMKHICDEDIQNVEEFDRLDGPDEGNTTEFHDKVLACPTVTLPGDDYTEDSVHFPEHRNFDFTVEGDDGETQTIDDATFQQQAVQESDIDVDVNGDGDLNDALDTSLYVYENVASGDVTVTETQTPGDTRPGALEFTPDALMENDDAATLAEEENRVFANNDTVVELDTTQDSQDNSIVLHIYNFQPTEAEQPTEPNVTQPPQKKMKKKMMKKKQPVERGSIRICKVLIDENNTVLTGEDLDAEFSTTISRDSDQATASFETPLNLTTDLNQDDAEDGECVRTSSIPLGTYQYSEENITGDDADNITVLGYNDDWEVGESNESEFFNFTANNLSDGEITLTSDDRQETLVILNQQLPVQEEEQAEEEEERVVKKGKKKMMKKKTMMKRMVPTQDQEEEQAEEEELAEEEEQDRKKFRGPAVDEDEQAEEEERQRKKFAADDEEEQALEEDELAEEETQTSSSATVNQEANLNIEQNADVSGSDASANQEANANIEQDANVEAS